MTGWAFAVLCALAAPAFGGKLPQGSVTVEAKQFAIESTNYYLDKGKWLVNRTSEFDARTSSEQARILDCTVSPGNSLSPSE